MTKIPFNAATLAEMPVPDDTTLGVLKGHFLNGPVARDLKGLSKFKRVQIFFLRNDEEECPDDMTIEEFRNLVPPGKIAIVDGEGGWKAKSPTPELV